MDEEVAESWEEAADSGVNNKGLSISPRKCDYPLGGFFMFTLLVLEDPVTLFHVNGSHGPTMWLMLTLALRNLAS